MSSSRLQTCPERPIRWARRADSISVRCTSRLPARALRRATSRVSPPTVTGGRSLLRRPATMLYPELSGTVVGTDDSAWAAGSGWPRPIICITSPTMPPRTMPPTPPIQNSGQLSMITATVPMPKPTTMTMTAVHAAGVLPWSLRPLFSAISLLCSGSAASPLCPVRRGLRDPTGRRPTSGGGVVATVQGVPGIPAADGRGCVGLRLPDCATVAIEAASHRGPGAAAEEDRDTDAGDKEAACSGQQGSSGMSRRAVHRLSGLTCLRGPGHDVARQLWSQSDGSDRRRNPGDDQHQTDDGPSDVSCRRDRDHGGQREQAHGGRERQQVAPGGLLRRRRQAVVDGG